MGVLYLACAFIANGVATVFLKVGADRFVSPTLSFGIGRLISSNAFLIGGVALFAVNLVFYVAALRVLPLSIAYPVMTGMSFLIANGAALLFLHESISWQHLVGYALIIGGITLVVSYAR